MMGYTTKEGDLGCYNRYKRRRERQDNSQDADRRTLSYQTTSEDVSRSDHETSGLSVNEQPIANYSTTETVSDG